MYCAVSDVAFKLQVDFDLASKPSQTDVESVITQITARMNLALGGAGIALPISDAAKLETLKHICAMGSAGMVGMAFGRNFDNVMAGQAKFYWDEFQKDLDLFCSNFTGSKIPGLSSGVLSPVAGGRRPEKAVDW